MSIRIFVMSGILSCALLVLSSVPSNAATTCGIATSGNERIIACRTVNNWGTNLRCRVKAWYYRRRQICNFFTCQRVWLWTYWQQTANTLETNGTCRRGGASWGMAKSVTNRRKITKVHYSFKWPWQNVCLTEAFARANNNNNLRVNFANMCR